MTDYVKYTYHQDLETLRQTKTLDMLKEPPSTGESNTPVLVKVLAILLVAFLIALGLATTTEDAGELRANTEASAFTGL